MTHQQQTAYRSLRFYRLHIVNCLNPKTGCWYPKIFSGSAPTADGDMDNMARPYPVCLN